MITKGLGLALYQTVHAETHRSSLESPMASATHTSCRPNGVCLASFACVETACMLPEPS